MTLERDETLELAEPETRVAPPAGASDATLYLLLGGVALLLITCIAFVLIAS